MGMELLGHPSASAAVAVVVAVEAPGVSRGCCRCLWVPLAADPPVSGVQDCFYGKGCDMVRINEQLDIPDSELTFTASRSGGPGGQNVNKVSTRVMLWFDIAASPSLSAEQKEMLLTHLANRVTRDGVLQIISQQHRTQPANREAAVERFVELLQSALKRPKARRKTHVPFGAKQRRLETKRHRSDIKRIRSAPPS